MKYKLLFHISALLLIATEAYRTFLLAPFPGSQEVAMVHVSYFLYHYRWIIRGILFAGMIIGYRKAFEKRPWIPMITLFFTGWIFYLANFVMTAEVFFKQPSVLAFAPPAQADLPQNALVIGVTYKGESKAYPIRYLAYHHYIMDTLGGMPVLVTYCDVCRSASVFDPVVDDKYPSFRLVGMDQWNAMLEDQQTGSWWMQANGTCVAGKMEGKVFRLVSSWQTTLASWTAAHPDTKVMLPDPKYTAHYGDETFENGTTNDELTHTDTASWQDNSWVIGIELGNEYRAYDWNELKRKRAITDSMDKRTYRIYVDSAGINFVTKLLRQQPSCIQDPETLDNLDGYESDIRCRQMFWHTWRTFYPGTTRYVNGAIIH